VIQYAAEDRFIHNKVYNECQKSEYPNTIERVERTVVSIAKYLCTKTKYDRLTAGLKSYISICRFLFLCRLTCQKSLTAELFWPWMRYFQVHKELYHFIRRTVRCCADIAASCQIPIHL